MPNKTCYILKGVSLQFILFHGLLNCFKVRFYEFYQNNTVHNM